MKNQKFWKVQKEGERYLVTPTLRDIDGELNDAFIGDKYSIEVIEMTQEEFEALPEFEG